MEGRPIEPARPVAAAGLLGYLNFSDGRTDPRWQRQLADLWTVLRADPARPADQPVWRQVRPWLLAQLDDLQAAGTSAFREVAQARGVIDIAFDQLPKAYRRHHSDLLASLADDDLFNPFFLARLAEATLAAGGPWDESDRIIEQALRTLNDYVGHRPVPVLEHRRVSEYRSREQVRPVPLWIQGVGSAPGPYAELIDATLTLIKQTEAEVLAEACFDLAQLEELAFDPRTFDHTHPANRRPNYAFGEWDPHRIDNRGYFRRFILRQQTLDAILSRVPRDDSPQRPNLLAEAAAVLAGTILMASGVSGWGPSCYDSTTTLTNLVPRIARFRDEFYARLITRFTGAHGDALKEEAQRLRQPFAGARQHLNQVLARQRAIHLQERRLATLYAEMGQPQAALERARRIQTVSARMLTELHGQQTMARLALDQRNPDQALSALKVAEDLLDRGIECGAIVDPWNILGFQGLFPLFQAREDSVRDPRVEELLDVMVRQFDLYARTMATLASMGQDDKITIAAQAMRSRTEWWDRFATSTVSDLQRLQGGERIDAAEHVARALALWHARGGETAGVAFWREHRDGFRSPSAYAPVVEALLEHGDSRAAMALLIAWLAQVEDVPLEDKTASFHDLVDRWWQRVSASPPSEGGPLLSKFLELLEANADHLGQVPVPSDLHAGGSEPDEPETEDDDTYGAAYESMSFRDSANDGEEGSVLGDAPPGSPFVLEELAPALETRLKFLATQSRLWQQAGHYALRPEASLPVGTWLETARAHAARLLEFLDALHALPLPEAFADTESVTEYERRRSIKEHITEVTLSAALEADLAVLSLQAAAGTQTDQGWEGPYLELQRLLAREDASTARTILPRFLERFAQEPLLFVPIGEGGPPRPIFQARRVRAVLESLLSALPRHGQLRETYHLLKAARSMEQNSPPEGRKVTEFDRLFTIGLRAIVESVLSAEESGGTPGDDRPAPARLEILRRVVDSLLNLWVGHSQSLRLSALESVQLPQEWTPLRSFVSRYGRELFTEPNLRLATIRGVLHRGVGVHLDQLLERPGRRPKLIDDLQAGRITRAEAVRALETVWQAVAENYDEYRDYNSTTSQSDYGEHLIALLDLLRIKATYDRYAWRMRPLALTHELLCRRGLFDDARRWEGNAQEFTQRLAEELLDRLAGVEREHGVRLRTLRDRLEERFVRPLATDRLAAGIAPALEEIQAGQQDGPAFRDLAAVIDELAAEPTGVGLDVPNWLRRLETELQRVREEAQRPPSEPPTPPPSLADIHRQLADWESPLS